MLHCPTCDAGLRFEIASQKMACDHCGNRYPVESIPDTLRSDAKGNKVLDLYVFTCPECGAELAVDSATDAIGFCPYCGGASMLFDRIRRSWVPDGIIPFKITKDQCKSAYVREVRRQPFVSRKYCDPNLIESFRGIYMPYWSFEGWQHTPYKVERNETVDGSSPDKRIKRVYEQWYETDYTITGLSHDASSQYDDHTSEHLAPYHDDSIEKFHPGYMSGFYAEIGDLDPQEYEQYASEKCQDYVSDKVPYSMSHEEKREIKTDIRSLSNKLYPVWFMSYRRGDKISYAAVNGETGKVSADLPLSPLKIVIVALITTLILFGLFNVLMGWLPSIKASDVLVLCAVLALASTCFLDESCINTIKDALRAESPYTHSIIFSFVMTIAAFLGYVFVATDGSYAGSLRLIGFVMFFVGSAYIVVWVLKQTVFMFDNINARRTSKSSQLENSIVETYSKYRTLFSVLKAILLVSCVIGAFLGFLGLIDKFACYGLCVVFGIEVLAFAGSQIAFQTAISERKPPQMWKRGAYYDER